MDGHYKEMPTLTADLEIEAEIEPEAFALIQKGFEPASPQDKWRLVFNDDLQLDIFRVASGSCIFTAQFAPLNDGYTITRALVNRDPAQYRSQDPVYDARLFIYLLRKLLLKHDVPFPLPADMPHRNKTIHEQHVMGQNQANPPIPLDVNE